MTTPLITIVIPVYNRAGVVMRTLDSIEAQTLRPLSIVLVDNASTDNSLEVITRWAEEMNRADSGIQARVTTCSTPGACAARNAGLELVDTPWVMFFDSDDIMLPTHLERAATTASENPQANIIGWNIGLYDSRGEKRIRTQHFEPHNILYHNLFHGALATLRYMVHTSLARSAGGWNGKIQAWNDIEFGTRLILSGAKAVKAKGDETAKACASAESITSESSGKGAAKRIEAVEEIRRHLPAEKRFWASVKLAILAAELWREGYRNEAQELINQTITTAPKGKRAICFLAYRYTRIGGRGIARILHTIGCI